MRDHTSSVPTRRLRLAALAFALAGLAACSQGGGIDLDPTSHKEVAKAPSVLTNPPPELKDGSAR
jgi:hypothetical protein